MKSLEKKLTINLLLLSFLIGFYGCLDSGRAGYPTIDQFESTDTDDTTNDSGSDEDVRLSNAITISNYCVCQNQKAIVVNNCEAECASRPDANAKMLYVSVTLDASIKEDKNLKTLYGWCNNAYGETNQSPYCQLKVEDENFNVQYLELEKSSLTTNSDSFAVNLSAGTINMNQRYKFSLVEGQSGAVSKKEGFMLVNLDDDSNTDRKLHLGAINMYSCVARSGSIINGDYDFESAVKMSFFYNSSDQPDAMPPSEKFVTCHDPYADGQGDSDSSDYPRLFLKTSIFTLWDKYDSFFTQDATQTDSLKINARIRELVEDKSNGKVTLTGDIFGTFRWPIAPAASTSSDEASSSTVDSSSNITSGDSTANPIIGYYMMPWIDEETDNPYCPGPDEFNDSSNVTFQVLKEFIGETEAIFMAKRVAKTITVKGVDKPAPNDVILIRESVLNRIWFYIDNTDSNKRKIADYNIAKRETIKFLWPPNFDAPLLDNSNNVEYVIKHPSDISDSSNATDSNVQVNKPRDKRFGCIPKQ